MAKAVELFQLCCLGLALVAAQLLDVVPVRRDQGAAAHELVDLLQQGSLGISDDRHRAGSPALGPAGLQADVVLADGIAGGELDGFLTPEAELGLEPEAQPDAGVFDPGQFPGVEILGLGGFCHVMALPDAVGMVVPGHHTGLVHLGGPPAQDREPVLYGTNGEALVFPERDQGLDVFRFERAWLETAIAKLQQLIGHLAQKAFSNLPCRMAPVPVVAAEGFQLVVQVLHGARSRSVSFSDQLAARWAYEVRDRLGVGPGTPVPEGWQFLPVPTA